MLLRALLPLVIALGLVASAMPACADEARMRIEVVGPDGKPVANSRVIFSLFGTNTALKQPVAGELIVVSVIDNQFRTGSTVVMVPKSGNITVVVRTGPVPYYYAHADRARRASEAGDLDTYNAEALQAREAVDQEKAAAAEQRRLLNQWKEEKYLPDMTAAEADAAVARAKAQGFKESAPSVQLLIRYKAYLAEIEAKEAAAKAHEDDFKTLQPPEKRTSMNPTACPNGEGGLLAGWINSVTGSDLAAACDINATRQKKDKAREGSRRERDHPAHD